MDEVAFEAPTSLLSAGLPKMLGMGARVSKKISEEGIELVLDTARRLDDEAIEAIWRAGKTLDNADGIPLEKVLDEAPVRTVAASADDVATLKSIRRHVERLAKGKVVSSDANTMMQVRSLQRHIANENYAAAGSRFHSLNFKFAREAQSRGGLRGLNIDRSIPTPGGFRPTRRPDYRFDSGNIFDLKPTRSSANAYDTTQQFQDIFGATGNMPIPLYYRLWVTP
jgi:hypothetical protein